MSGQPYDSPADHGNHASNQAENISSMYSSSEFSPFYQTQNTSQYYHVQAPFPYSMPMPGDPHPFGRYSSTMNNAQYLSRARQDLSHFYRTHRAATSCSSQDRSLVSSASSRQSFLPSNPSGSNSPADRAFPTVPNFNTNLSSSLDSACDMGINALGLAPGRPVTPPQFGQATLATLQPVPGPSDDHPAHSDLWSMYQAQSGLAPPAEIFDSETEAIGPFQNPQTVHPEQLGHQLTEATADLLVGPSATSSSQSSSTVHAPTPAIASRKLSKPPPTRRVTKSKAKRDFPYARSAHIQTVENARKEIAYKRGPWTADEEKVLREVSDDYDVQFLFKYGNEAIIDPVEKWGCIVEEIEAALPTFRSPHMILIQAAVMELKPSTTTPARKEKQELKKGKAT